MTSISVPGSRARDVAVINARIDRLPNWGLGTAGYLILGACYLFAFYDIAVFGTALPAIAATFHLSAGQIGVPVMANLIGYMVGALGLGNLADRFGRRPVLAVVVLIIAVTSILTAFSWDLVSLSVWRFGAGIGTGAMITMAATLIGEYSPADKRGRYLARNAFWSTIGNIIPASLALALIQQNGVGVGWRILLVVPVLIALVLIGFRDRLLPESPRWLSARGDQARAERIVAELERRTSVAALTEQAADAAVTEAAAGQEAAFSRMELLRRPFVGRLAVVFGLWFFFYFGMYAFLAFGPQLYEAMHAGVPAANLMTALGFAGGAVIAALQILWIDRVERKYVIIGGFAVYVIGFILMATSPDLVMLTVGSVVASTGAIAGMIPAYAYTAEIFPTRARASAMGLGDGLGHIGGAIQALIIPAVLVAAGPRSVWWLLAGSLFIALCFMLAAVRTTGRSLSDLATTD